MVVYRWCMSRTNVDIDDEACEKVMRMFALETKRDAINFALRKVAARAMSKAEVLAMRGSMPDIEDVRDESGLVTAEQWGTDASR
jgi:Arc/MetJ family transcription regulator